MLSLHVKFVCTICKHFKPIGPKPEKGLSADTLEFICEILISDHLVDSVLSMIFGPTCYQHRFNFLHVEALK